MNKAILIGRVGKELTKRVTPAGKTVASFSLATNNGKDKPATWHNVVVWDKTAEVCLEYLKKGHQVGIEGRIDNRSYDDKDGNKRYISEVIADRVHFLQSKSEGAADVPEGEPAGDVDDSLPF